MLVHNPLHCTTHWSLPWPRIWIYSWITTYHVYQKISTSAIWNSSHLLHCFLELELVVNFWDVRYEKCRLVFMKIVWWMIGGATTAIWWNSLQWIPSSSMSLVPYPHPLHAHFNQLGVEPNLNLQTHPVWNASATTMRNKVRLETSRNSWTSDLALGKNSMFAQFKILRNPSMITSIECWSENTISDINS